MGEGHQEHHRGPGPRLLQQLMETLELSLLRPPRLCRLRSGMVRVAWTVALGLSPSFSLAKQWLLRIRCREDFTIRPLGSETSKTSAALLRAAATRSQASECFGGAPWPLAGEEGETWRQTAPFPHCQGLAPAPSSSPPSTLERQEAVGSSWPALPPQPGNGYEPQTEAMSTTLGRAEPRRLSSPWS